MEPFLDEAIEATIHDSLIALEVNRGLLDLNDLYAKRLAEHLARKRRSSQAPDASHAPENAFQPRQRQGA
jgi:hypothetical protein